jgi:23S rRNA (adenine2503-C2)-methyltransferase
VEILNFTREEMTLLMKQKYGKGSWHGDGLFSHLYGTGSLKGLEQHPAFLANTALAAQICGDWNFRLPDVIGESREEETVKALLNYPTGGSSESVFIPMDSHNTLCVSSQVGCKRGCSFCRTAKMGLVRNLTAGEIVAQVMHHRFREGREIRNIVFMGMGEPFDNLDEVLRAVDILSDFKGLSILKRFISLSTCGHGEGVDRLAHLIRTKPEKSYQNLRLAVSINSVDGEKRSKMMPVNLKWPLASLKTSLEALPQSQKKNGLYFEYVLIRGVNDSREDSEKLLRFMEGLTVKVNLIPLHGEEKDTPTQEELDRFRDWIVEGGRECRTRKSKGKNILAACGQLAAGSDPYST